MAPTSGASFGSVWLTQYFVLPCLTQKFHKHTIKVISVQEGIVENRKIGESFSTCLDGCF